MTRRRRADRRRASTPVVRLAPAKLNLTLAVVGRRPDGFHALHSVMVPLGARRPAEPGARPRRPRDTLHVDGPRRRPARGQPRAPGDRRGAGGRRRRPVRPVRRPTPARSPPGSRSGSRSRPASAAAAATPPPRSTRRSRPGAPSSTPDDGRARSPRRSARTCRSSWPAARRSSRAAASASRRCPIRIGAPPGVLLVTPAVAGADAGRLRRLRGRHPAGGRRREPADLASTSPRELRARAHDGRACSTGPAILAAANDLAAGRRRPSCPASSPFRRALRRLLGRPVGQSGLGPDALGALSFAADGRGGRRAPRPRGRSPTGGSTAPGDVPTASSLATDHRDRAGGVDPMNRHAISTERRAGRHRSVQPGHRRRTASCSAPGQVGLDPATGELVEGGIEAQAERALREPGRRPRRRRADLRRRRQDDDLPRRHGRLRGRQRGLRPVRRRPAAGPLDGRRRRPARRAPASRSRRSPAARRRLTGVSARRTLD